jgi:DNA-binding GntR family transcriptional regulator
MSTDRKTGSGHPVAEAAAGRSEPSTLALVDRIVHDIQTGHFGPGAWLKQIDLQERYGATRLDVRRTLFQLTQMRVTEHVPNRGHHVYAIDEARLREMREVRVLLETGAAADLLPNVTDAQVRKLRALAKKFRELTVNGTVLDMHPVNKAFHEMVYAMCTNRTLAAIIQEMRMRMPSGMSMQSRTQVRVARSAQEHFDIVDALQARDLVALRKVIAAHVRQDALID